MYLQSGVNALANHGENVVEIAQNLFISEADNLDIMRRDHRRTLSILGSNVGEVVNFAINLDGKSRSGNPEIEHE